MTTPARDHRAVAVRLLRRERAATYLDMSPGTFDKLVKEGIIPAPKKLHSMRVWDRDDLDSLADHLPYDGANAPSDSSWD